MCMLHFPCISLGLCVDNVSPVAYMLAAIVGLAGHASSFLPDTISTVSTHPACVLAHLKRTVNYCCGV